MFRIDNYVEQWAVKYKPISHNPAKNSKERAFYRIDSIDATLDLAANISIAKSPACAVATEMEAQVSPASNRKVVYTYRIFFMTRQHGASLSVKAVDGTEEMECKVNNDEMVQDFLAYISTDKKNGNRELAGLDLDGAEWYSAPVKFNNWWFTVLVIKNLLPRNLCVNPEKYNI